MARKNSSSNTNNPQNAPNSQNTGLDIQQQIEELEEQILEGFRIPLTKWTVIDEESLIEQLDLVIESIPQAVKQAMAILKEEQQIRLAAETHYQQMIESAQQRAAEILDQTGIIQKAEIEANQIRQQVQAECEAIQQKTLQEIEQMRQITTQEMSQHRQQVLAETEEMQREADQYADRNLAHLEQRLGEMLQEFNQMLQVVRNGRQQIKGNLPPNPVIPPQITPKKPKTGTKKTRA